MADAEEVAVVEPGIYSARFNVAAALAGVEDGAAQWDPGAAVDLTSVSCRRVRIGIG